MRATAILGPDGWVARKLPNYEHRPQQLEMAKAVEAAFEAQEHLIVEAGTGVGKSFAYLVPAIQRALSGGGPVVISTHTIALQEQLINKDIPFLQKIFPEEFSAVLVKGRSNYLGLRRLARASGHQKMLFDTGSELSELHTIEDWAYKTEDGSLSDLPRQPDRAVWDRIRSDGDDCFGRRCPHYKACFYQRARRRASSAQLLIVNHAMLFSDLAVRQLGASILPSYDYVVLDEAHTAERVAGDHLGLNIANVQIRYLLNMLHNERTGKGLLQSGSGRDAIPAVSDAHTAIDEYFDSLVHWHTTQGIWNGRLREPPPVDNRASFSLIQLREALNDVRKDSENEDTRLELAGLME